MVIRLCVMSSDVLYLSPLDGMLKKNGLSLAEKFVAPSPNIGMQAKRLRFTKQ